VTKSKHVAFFSPLHIFISFYSSHRWQDYLRFDTYGKTVHIWRLGSFHAIAIISTCSYISILFKCT